MYATNNGGLKHQTHRNGDKENFTLNRATHTGTSLLTYGMKHDGQKFRENYYECSCIYHYHESEN